MARLCPQFASAARAASINSVAYRAMPNGVVEKDLRVDGAYSCALTVELTGAAGEVQLTR